MTRFAAPLALERPDEAALTDPDRSLTWAEVDDVLNRAANALQALDLGGERRVAVFAENCIETALANLGGLLGSCSVVPVNFHLTADEVAHILDDSDSRVLFVGPDTVERGVAAAAEAGIGTVVGWRCEPIAGVTPWEDWLAASSPDEPRNDLPPRPNLLYTSGTTGRPPRRAW